MGSTDTQLDIDDAIEVENRTRRSKTGTVLTCV